MQIKDLSQLQTNKKYYIIFKNENVIIPLGILQDKIKLREFLSFHWHEGPTYGDLQGYGLYFSNVKDINLKKRLEHITLKELDDFFQEYDGFYVLDK